MVGARNDSVKKMTIILTDGHSQVDPSEAILPLSQIKNMDVFAVAVVPLDQVDESELLIIANNEPGRVFTKSNLDQFEFKFKDYVSLSCAGSDIADAGEPTVRGPTDVQCDENSLTLTVRTMRPFVGRLYTLGYENDDQCSTVGQNATTVSIKISTRGKCGVLKSVAGAPDPGYVYNVSFMIQFHPNVITRLDQIVLANCFTPSNGALKEAAKDFSPAKKEITCSYILQQYHPENGCAVLDARVGDNVYHKWTCDMGPDHDYIVHNCDAVTDKTTIAILDEHGCQVDPNIFETPVYDGKKSFIFRDSWMFKFPGVTWMQFKCKISICNQQNGNCSGLIPPNCGNRRRKREDINSKIVQTLDVETRRINVLVSDELKPIEKLHFCTNFY
uniref:ZP domain-containing protein n=1 Tax=Romanomermis culicivorax TaxID=13658 RepID=A0A915J194_ROMCU